MGEPSIKRAVSVSVDARLLEEADRLHIDLSETLERRLRAMVDAEKKEPWEQENADALASINDFIDHHGLLASKLRYRAE